jgi:hypothetical protein
MINSLFELSVCHQRRSLVLNHNIILIQYNISYGVLLTTYYLLPHNDAGINYLIALINYTRRNIYHVSS